MNITHKSGSVFAAPRSSIVVHATNCLGEWGRGFARTLRDEWPSAYRCYEKHCLDALKEGRSIVGTCLLIPARQHDYHAHSKNMWIACLFTSFGYGTGRGRAVSKKGARAKANTAEGEIGRAKRDKPEVVLKQTEEALKDFKKKLLALEENSEASIIMATSGLCLQVDSQPHYSHRAYMDHTLSPQRPEDIWSPKFNSGLFGVPWARTEKILKDVFEGVDVGGRNWIVATPEDVNARGREKVVKRLP